MNRDHLGIAGILAVGILALIFIALVAFCPRAEGGVPDSWTVADSISKGTHWGGKKSIKGAKRMFELHYPTFWFYGVGRDPVTQSFIAWTETGHTGNPLSSTKDTTLGEAGLLSVKRSIARNLDVDACVAEQNVWAAAEAKLTREEKILKYNSWAEKLSAEDKWFLAGMYGGSGDGAAVCVLKHSNAKAKLKSKKWKGSLKLTIKGWFEEIGDGLTAEKYDECWGRTDAETVVFRMMRIHAIQKMVYKIYGGGKKGQKRWEACTRPANMIAGSPFGEGNYPGDVQHGACDPTPKKTWDMPPAGHRRKFVKGKKVDLWGKYCGSHQKCLDGDNSLETYYEAVWPNWKKVKQIQGLLPSDEEYAQAKLEMEAAGCWILD